MRWHNISSTVLLRLTRSVHLHYSVVLLTKSLKMPKRSATEPSDSAGAEVAAAAAADDSSAEDNTTPAPPCPTGGPGGPRCCSRCSTSYARILSHSGKTSEMAAVAGVGQEVAQLQEMLRDAQTRLRLAVDVSKENDVRRGTV